MGTYVQRIVHTMQAYRYSNNIYESNIYGGRRRPIVILLPLKASEEMYYYNYNIFCSTYM